MNLRTGVDLIEIKRVQDVIEKHGSRFLGRVFTPYELDEVGHNIASLAARFAAKEAVAKALGTGIGSVAWQEIEIRRGPEREPQLFLYGEAQRQSEIQGLHTWSVSLSHAASHAIAMVVAVG
ncbi:MAG: holo-ACP synthase [Anaerolineales bacterium]|jgi:holo-[acyl-carrier protein] synthase